jgi:hypothetical protein
MNTTARWITGIAVVLCVGALATLAYFVWWQPKNPTEPITKETSTQQNTPATVSKTVTSAKGVTIELDDWPKDSVLTGSQTITGKVPGSWSFEGEFPIDVVYEGDIGLPGATAKLQGNWMTTNMVPFTATLTFDERTMESDDVAIMLRNANPSGLPENDDSVRIPIHFKQ